MNEVKTPKKPLIYYYIIVMLLLLLFQFLAMPLLSQARIQTVDYNTFVSMVEAGDVTFTPNGKGHAMTNSGDEDLVFMALIIFD